MITEWQANIDVVHAAFKVGLLVVDDQMRYKVNQEEIIRLKFLSGLRR